LLIPNPRAFPARLLDRHGLRPDCQLDVMKFNIAVSLFGIADVDVDREPLVLISNELNVTYLTIGIRPGGSKKT
jgi:hypothetical protein